MGKRGQNVGFCAELWSKRWLLWRIVVRLTFATFCDVNHLRKSCGRVPHEKRVFGGNQNRVIHELKEESKYLQLTPEMNKKSF